MRYREGKAGKDVRRRRKILCIFVEFFLLRRGWGEEIRDPRACSVGTGGYDTRGLGTSWSGRSSKVTGQHAHSPSHIKETSELSYISPWFTAYALRILLGVQRIMLGLSRPGSVLSRQHPWLTGVMVCWVVCKFSTGNLTFS